MCLATVSAPLIPRETVDTCAEVDTAIGEREGADKVNLHRAETCIRCSKSAKESSGVLVYFGILALEAQVQMLALMPGHTK
jgi:hypothetical protein